MGGNCLCIKRLNPFAFHIISFFPGFTHGKGFSGKHAARNHGDAVGEPLFLRKPEEIALKRKRTVDAEDRERAGRAGEDIRPDRQCVGTLQPAEDEQMRRAPARLRLIARQIADSAVDARVVLKHFRINYNPGISSKD